MIGDLLEEGMVYAGWSAGACVAGTSLRSLHLMDDPEAAAPGYPSAAPIRDGRGLVPYTIVPHYRSDHPEAAAADLAVAHARAEGLDHVALRDGEVIVDDGTGATVLDRLGP